MAGNKNCPVCVGRKRRHSSSRSRSANQNADFGRNTPASLLEYWPTGLRHADPEIRSATINALVTGKCLHLAQEELLAMLTADENCFVRGRIAEIFSQYGDRAYLEPCIFAREHDTHWYVRLMAVEFLGARHEIQAVTALVNALLDADESVRTRAAEALEQQRWVPATDAERILYLCIRKEEHTLLAWGPRAIEPIRLQIAVYPTFQERLHSVLQQICAGIRVVVFEAVSEQVPAAPTVWHNPNVAALTLPLAQLERLDIDADTADFYVLEQFLTYAVAYLGQQYLEEHVVAVVRGNSERLHPNLRNNLKNLCARVEEVHAS